MKNDIKYIQIFPFQLGDELTDIENNEDYKLSSMHLVERPGYSLDPRPPRYKTISFSLEKLERDYSTHTKKVIVTFEKLTKNFIPL